MTRRKYSSNAEKQAAYRERLKKKQRERWETLFKKDKTIQPAQEVKSNGLEPSSVSKEFHKEEIEDLEENLTGTWIDITR